MLLAVAVTACGPTRVVRLPDWWVNWQCQYVPEARTIHCNGKELARIECMEQDGFHPCRGLRVIYNESGQVAWLYKPHGYVEGEPLPYPQNAKLASAVPALVARDGRKIWFQTWNGFFTGVDWKSYSVLDGIVSMVDEQDVSDIRAASRDGRGIWISEPLSW